MTLPTFFIIISILFLALVLQYYFLSQDSDINLDD